MSDLHIFKNGYVFNADKLIRAFVSKNADNTVMALLRFDSGWVEAVELQYADEIYDLVEGQ